MDEDKRIEKSFDYAYDLTKLMTSLAIGIVSLCFAFSEKIVDINDFLLGKIFLVCSFISFLISIFIGLSTMMSFAGVLGNLKKGLITNTENSKKSDQPSIYNEAITSSSKGQIYTFFGGLGFGLAFLSISLFCSGRTKSSQKSLDTLLIIQKIEGSSDTVYINLINSNKRQIKRKGKPAVQNSSCLKSIIVNTCKDTIIAKKIILNP